MENLGDGQLYFSGKLKSWVPDLDEDDIDAFVLTYRLLTQNNDRLSLARISELYNQDWMPSEATSRFREARTHLNNYLDSAATLEFGTQRIAIRQLVDIVLYGGLAHSNESKAELFCLWVNNLTISGLMWVEFMAAMKEALFVFSYLRRLNETVIEAGA